MGVQHLKKTILNMSYDAGACHIGSALSCAAIVYRELRDKNPDDFFIFGKASGVAALYAMHVELGLISYETGVEYLKNYPLPTEGICNPHTFGSVGHALSVAAGMAYAMPSRKVTVLLSDGDCQEGSTLEAAMFAHAHNLENLYVIVDNNKLQACGFTENICNVEPAYQLMSWMPNFKVVNTIKGDGVSFMEDSVHWHYKNLDKKLLDKALKELD